MTDLPADAIRQLQAPHRFGHQCAGQWYNGPVTGVTCPTMSLLTQLDVTLADLRESVHAAAHNDAACRHVAEAMTTQSMNDLSPDAQEGWTHLARLAIEGLSEWLDQQDPTRHTQPTEGASTP